MLSEVQIASTEAVVYRDLDFYLLQMKMIKSNCLDLSLTLYRTLEALWQ